MADATRRWLGIALGGTLLLSALAALSYLYVSSQAEYLTQRKFRLLALYGEQLKSSIENYTQRRLPNVIRATEITYNITSGEATPAGQKTEPATAVQWNIDQGDLKFIGDTSPVPEHKKYPETKVVMRASQEGNALRLRFSYDGPAGEDFKVAFEATAHIDHFLETSGDEAFDALLLGDEQGQVVFQRHPAARALGQEETRSVQGEQTLSGASILSITDLLRQTDSEAAGSAAKSSDQAKPPDQQDAVDQGKSSLPQFSRLRKVVVAGEEYNVFVYPLRIALYAPNQKIAEKTQPLLIWTLAGLIRSESFRSESLTTSYTVVMLFLLMFLVILLSWPFLKISSIGHRDWLRYSDVLALALSVLTANALLGLYLFNIYAYPRLESILDDQLKTLATKVKGNFDVELNQLGNLLNGLSAHTQSSQSPLTGVLTKPVLNGTVGESLPYFESINWVDDRGQQTHKWTIRNNPTQSISVADRGYVQNIWNGHAWDREIDVLTDPEGAMVKRAIKFWLEPVQTWTTGASLAVISTPLQGKAVLSATAKLPSLRGVVLPPGFGFLVVEGSGNMLFHCDLNHLRENLIEECEGDRELKAALFARTPEFLNIHYLGHDNRFYITPLEGLPWSLVVYRTKSVLRSANTEILSVAVALYIIYALLLLVPVCYLLLWRTDAIWPKAKEAEDYMHVALSCLIGGVLVIWASYRWESIDLFFASLLVPLVSLLVTHKRLAERGHRRALEIAAAFVLVLLWAVWLWIAQTKIPPLAVLIVGGLIWASAPMHLPFGRLFGPRLPGRRAAYLFAFSALLGITGLIPALAFYTISYRAETLRLVRHGQLNLFRSMMARIDKINDEYRDVSKPDGFLKRRAKAEFDVYDNFYFGTKHASDLLSGADSGVLNRPVLQPIREEGPAADELFERFLEKVRPLYNDTAAENHSLIHEQSVGSLFRWVSRDDHIQMIARMQGKERALLVSSRPTSFPSLAEPGWLLLLLAVASASLCVPVLSSWFMSRHVLFLGFEEPPRLSPVKPDLRKVNRSVLILGPPFAGKSNMLATAGVPIRDLRTLTGRPGAWLEAMELEKIAKESPVVIDHLDYDMENPETNGKKVELLEKLLNNHRIVIAASSVDPMNFNFKGSGSSNDGRAAQLLDRWAGVLSVFDKQHVCGELGSDNFDEKLRETRKSKAASKRVLDQIERECRELPYLRRIGLALLDAPLPESREQVISEVLDRADAYYRALWAASSQDEKTALYDLGQDGFLNSRNPGIRSLLQRRLLLMDPRTRLLNESFQRFVIAAGLGAGLPEMAASERRSPWHTLRWILLAIVLGILLILYFTQRSFFDSIMLFLGALGGGIAAFFKLMDIFRAGHPASSAST